MSADEMDNSKTIKLWNYNKTKGFLISGLNKFDDLVRKGREKYKIDHQDVRFVLEDGLEVQEDSFQAIEMNSTMFILESEETLQLNMSQSSQVLPSSSQSSQEEPSSNNSLLDIVKKIRDKKSSKRPQNDLMHDNEKKKRSRSSSLKINVGWLLYSDSKKTFQQVRAATGGGTRTIELGRTSSYDDVMSLAKDLFFPGGWSGKGPSTSFEHSLGDFKQNQLPENGFTIDEYAKRHCLANRPRVYLMSKEKQSEDDSDSLPDIHVVSDTESVEEQRTLREVLLDHQQQYQHETQVHDHQLETLPHDHQPETQPHDHQQQYDLQLETQPHDHQLETPPHDHQLETQPRDYQQPYQHETQPQLDVLWDQNSTLNQYLHEDINEYENETQAQNNPVAATNNDTSTSAVGNNSMEQSSLSSPTVTLRMPQIPICTICTDRYCDAFLDCGHIACMVCASELEERSSRCHVCRLPFTAIKRLYY